MTSTSSGLTMLTTGVSQYLHPDYLQPLPTTLDAKKSPLALLAQTCSAIGKDTSPSKPIIPPLEKKENNNDKPLDKSLGEPENTKRPSSHGNSKDSGRDSKPGFRTFPPKEIPPLVPISGSAGSDKPMSLSGAEPKSSSPSGPVGASVPPSSCPPSSSRPVSAGGHVIPNQRSSSRSSTGKGEGSSSSSSSESHPHHQHSSNHAHHRHRDSPASSSGSSSSHPSAPSPSYSKPSSSGSTPVMHNSLSSSSSSSSSSLTHSSSTVKPSATHPSVLGGLPTPAHLGGYPNPLALMGHGLDPSSSSYHSALAAAHSSLSSFSVCAAAQSSALKAAAAAGSPSALSPFVTYARVRTPSGATTLVPVCRDPYCNNCQLTVQNSHLSSNCNAPGCAQCAHEKSLTSLSTLGLAGAPSAAAAAAAASSMLLPPFSSSTSLSSSMSALSSLHSLYPHSALVAAHQGLPYVCNWIAGNDYCGKRFSSSEELLQHLRTHTSSMDVSNLAASYAGLGLPSALAAYPHLAAPAPLSPNSLRRSYPTSLSPVSSLLGASRYHPYKSPLSGVGATPPAPQSFPPVGPYYSPYAIYGQRIGAAVVP
ncbi:zinc finger protein Noc [Aplysia californica]|uniref:Zinc finger protein Noc n=1 Tax=Aplysia californica TaxID=6500 RepID=A0ABM0JAK8_APLCA|nr:zinc finger protein Noc [Aplysia californica]